MDLRTVRTLNRDWMFVYDPAASPDERRAAQDQDASEFQPVALPHTWHTYETTGAAHPFVRDHSEAENPYWWKGWGWYRKSFSVDRRHAARRVFLECDGVQKYCRVFCNGAQVGEHAGGFSGFDLDLTDHLRFGGDNVLAIVVSALQADPRHTPPMIAGNWATYGGMYRDARLVIKHPVHIPYQGSCDHEGGTSITTPVVNRRNAQVRVTTHIRNAGSSAARVVVRQRILDPRGDELVAFETETDVSGGADAMVVQDSPMIARPRLWSPDSPALHAVQTTLRVDGRDIDAIHEPLGFRWFCWDDATNALYLNDERVRLSGMNRHQEYPWLGDALPKFLHEADLRDMRENLGVNFARWCHYPQDKFVYDWCDAMDPDCAPLPPDEPSGQMTGTEAWQHAGARIRDANIRGRVDDDTVVWIYADHGAGRVYRHCPLKYINPKGWVDPCRQPKQIYWLWQANHSPRLMVHVRDYFWRPPMIGSRRDIVVDSNGERVALYVDDTLIGECRPCRANRFSVVFENVPVRKGVLRAVARRGAETVAHEVPMSGAAAALRLCADPSSIIADRAGIALITADVVDPCGVPVIGARPPIRWRVEGPGRLLAPEVFTSDIDRRGALEGTFYTVTPVVVPIRSCGTPGSIRITASSRGLRSADVAVESRLPAPTPDDGILEPPVADRERTRSAAPAAAARRGAPAAPLFFADIETGTTDRDTIRRRLWATLGAAASLHRDDPAAGALVEHLTELARTNRGVLIADDANFHLGRFMRERRRTPA